MALRSFSIIFTIFLAASAPVAQEPVNLVLSEPVEQAIKAGEKQSFTLQLPARQTAKIEIEQKGIDVAVSAFKPNATESFLDFDTPNGFYDKDINLLTADEAGRYKIEVSISTSETGSGVYIIRVAEIRPSVPQDFEINQAAAQIFKLYKEAQEFNKKGTAESRRRAIENFQKILPLTRIKQDRYWEGLALERLGGAYRNVGDSRKALQFYEEALTIARELNFKRKTGQLFNQIGLTYYYLSNSKLSLENLEKSLPLVRESRDRQTEAGVLNNFGLVYGWINEAGKSIDFYEKALVLYRELNDRETEGTVLNNIGLTYSYQSNIAKAIEYYEKALVIWREFNDQDGIALTLNNIGIVHHNSGDVKTALGFYLQALPLRRETGDRAREATILLSIGSAYDRLGEIEKAFEFYHQSLKIDRELGTRKEGLTLNNMALLHHILGDDEKALELYNESLKLRRENSDPRGEAVVLGNIGSLHEANHELEKARSFYEQALKISENIKNKSGEALSLGRLSSIERKNDNLPRAVELLDQALKINRELTNRREEASNLANLGFISETQGDKNKALKLFTQAGNIWSSLEDKNQTALLLYRQAKIRKDLNLLPEARKSIEEAISMVERLRTKIPNQRLRASYFATIQQYYELYIEILRRENPNNSAIATFELSERSRSRSLLEVLQQARIEIGHGLDAQLLQQEKDLQDALNSKSRQLTTLLSGKNTPHQIEKAKQEIVELENEWETLQTRIRRQNPRYAMLTQAKPLPAQEIQNLLDEETVLLEYKLGEARSFLWLVTNAEVQVFDLPGRLEIEKTGQEFYEAVTGKQKTDELSARLSRIIFPNISEKIKNKRLAIVADGVLQYLPFSALVENETLTLPAAGVLAELRQTVSKPAGKTVAIFADPVFDRNDPRFATHPVSSLSNQLKGVGRDFSFGENLPRLLSSRFEAQNISRLVKPGQADLRLDFEANRETVLQQKLSDYRILHFATHGLLDSSRPEFSGLIFSLYDRNGRAQDGFLRLNQIYNLNLKSDLVVLSACQTALGKDVRGEGLIGLTRGFMYAGAKRIVASLWKVDDAATAEFMKRFYQNLLIKNQSPSSALRRTQSEMKQIPRFKSPYYWAGFTIQGDWR